MTGMPTLPGLPLMPGLAGPALYRGVGVPANNLFAIGGDSRAAADHLNSDSATIFHRVDGLGFWLQQRTGDRVRFRREHDFAVAGSTSEDFLNNQVPSIAACDAANVLILTSTNDQGANNWAASRSIAALEEAIADLLAAGKWLWIVTELPRGSSAFTSARFTAQQQIDHDLVRGYLLALSHPRIKLIDAHSYVVDAGVPTDFTADATYDGVHLSSNGAREATTDFANKVISLFPADDFEYSASDTYNASTNPTGNLLANSEMSGTGGSGVNGSTILGQVTDGYTAAVASFTGLTATFSKVTDGEGKTWQQIRVQGNSPSGTPLVQCRRNITFGNVSLADVLELRYGEWEVDAGAVGFLAPEANIARLLSGANVQSSRSGSRANTPPWPSEAIEGRWRSSSELTIAGDENTVQFAAQFYVQPSTTGVDFTVRFRAPVLRKVIA